MILIVSADTATTDHLQVLLEGQFSPLLLAKSREEALELASRHPVKLAIVNLEDPPEAYDILHGLLDLLEDPSIIVISDPEHRQAVMPLIQTALVTHLEKPLDSAQLKSKINQLLGLVSVEIGPVQESPSPPRVQEVSPQMDPVSIDRLIMDLAHRLKNPLVSIRTFAHLFKERFNDAQFQKDFYQTMRQEVERIDSLIDQLIEFSELPDPSMALHPVLPIVEEAVKRANDRFKVIKVHLENNLKDKSPVIEVDKEQLIYALTHLLSGLGSCLPKFGRSQILVHLHRATSDSEGVEILLKSSASLFQDKAQFWGLELFMAKRIIERQHGLVQWEVSSEGQPSLRILLPMNSPTPLSSREVDTGPWKHTVPPYLERRKQQLAIPFRDRRSRQRRLYTRSSYFPNRRRAAPATAQL